MDAAIPPLKAKRFGGVRFFKEGFVMSQTQSKTRKLALIPMLCAMAVLAVAVIRIPVVLFLKYEPKDVVIVLGGLMMGPLASFLISVISSLIEMLTVSDTGLWGLLMNVISSCAYACTAAAIYKKKHTMSGAVVGLLCGTAAMAIIMLLWNYMITPIYMGTPREVVAGMLLPTFLPFNLLKGGLNTGLTLLIYKPLTTALRKAHLLKETEEPRQQGRLFHPGIVVLAVALLATCVVFVLVLNGTI